MDKAEKSAFVTIEEFTSLFRDLTHDETESFELKAKIVSDAIRQEAINVGEDIDQLISDGKVLENVVLEITVTVLARWITQPTDFPTVDGSEDEYDPSVTWYNNANSGIIILRRELQRLGILNQEIIIIGGGEK